MRIVFNDRQLGPMFRRGARRQADRVGRSVTSAAHEAARDIRKLGTEDIKAGGRFGPRWTRGLRTIVQPPRGSFSADANIKITHDLLTVGFRLFEYGGIVRGKPMLWIPLSFATDAQRVRARDYPQPLFRVDRLGRAPLLVSRDGPKYFGKEQVRIPRKFHIRDIGVRVARGFQKLYNKYFRLYRSMG